MLLKMISHFKNTIFVKKYFMFDVSISTIYGFGIGLYYTNEDIEGIDKLADDLRHTLQIAFFFIIININWFTNE